MRTFENNRIHQLKPLIKAREQIKRFGCTLKGLRNNLCRAGQTAHAHSKNKPYSFCKQSLYHAAKLQLFRNIELHFPYFFTSQANKKRDISFTVLVFLFLFLWISRILCQRNLTSSQAHNLKNLTFSHPHILTLIPSYTPDGCMGGFRLSRLVPEACRLEPDRCDFVPSGVHFVPREAQKRLVETIYSCTINNNIFL